MEKKKIEIEESVLEKWLDMMCDIHTGVGSGNVNEVFLAGIATMEMQNNIEFYLNEIKFSVNKEWYENRF